MDNSENSSGDDLLLIAVAYRYIQRSRRRREQELQRLRDQRRRQRREICPLFLTRDEEGAMEILVNRHLRQDENRFRQYFRFSFESFAFVLRHIERDITSVATNVVSQPISPEVKLAVTLR